jgi:hypothetical protein
MKKHILLPIVLLFVLLVACDEEPTTTPLMLNGLSSLSGVAGDTLSIFGEGFSTNPADYNITFASSSTQAVIVSASSSKIDVRVPNDAKDGVISVTLKGSTLQTEEIFFIDRTILSGPFKVTTTLFADKKYLLKGNVSVPDGIVLTIEEGTVIFADRLSKASLTIERGGFLIARGSALKPIVFTSDQPLGSRTSGDWRGLVFLSSTNAGVLSYVRVEFAGASSQAGVTGSSIAFLGTGSATQIDHVQAAYSEGDSFSFEAASLDAKYLISFACKDDDFQSVRHNGKVQFGLALRDVYTASDNVFKGKAHGIEILPLGFAGLSNVVYSNITYIGPEISSRLIGILGNPTNVFNQDFGDGVYIQSDGSLLNSVLIGANLAGIGIGATEGEIEVSDEAGIQLRNNIILATRPETAFPNALRGGGIALQSFSLSGEPQFNRPSIALTDRLALLNNRIIAGAENASPSDDVQEITEKITGIYKSSRACRLYKNKQSRASILLRFALIGSGYLYRL